MKKYKLLFVLFSFFLSNFSQGEQVSDFELLKSFLLREGLNVGLVLTVEDLDRQFLVSHPSATDSVDSLLKAVSDFANYRLIDGSVIITSKSLSNLFDSTLSVDRFSGSFVDFCNLLSEETNSIFMLSPFAVNDQDMGRIVSVEGIDNTTVAELIRKVAVEHTSDNTWRVMGSEVKPFFQSNGSKLVFTVSFR